MSDTILGYVAVFALGFLVRGLVEADNARYREERRR